MTNIIKYILVPIALLLIFIFNDGILGKIVGCIYAITGTITILAFCSKDRKVLIETLKNIIKS